MHRNTPAFRAAGGALWVVYGLAIGSVPMIAANAITLVLAGTTFPLAGTSRR